MKRKCSGHKFLFYKQVITHQLGIIVFFLRIRSYDLPDLEFIFDPLAFNMLLCSKPVH